MDALSLDSLLRIEHAGWDSLRTGRGGEFYGELMTNVYRLAEGRPRLALYQQTSRFDS